MTFTATPLGSEFQINTNIQNGQSSPKISSLQNGGYVVVWESYIGTLVPGSSYKRNVYDVKAQILDANGNKVGAEFTVNTIPEYTSDRPAVDTLADGSFVIAYQTDEGEIYMRRYMADGTAMGGEELVNTTVSGRRTNPEITALDDGGFVVSWDQIDGTYSPIDIKAQRFDATSTMVGSEFAVNTYAADNQINSSLTALNSGGFVTVWSSDGQDGSEEGIYGRVYNAAGVAGSEFRVNNYTTDEQRLPQVSSLASGGFVVVWQSWDQESDTYYGVRGQRYAADGSTLGAEFPVNTYTANYQHLASVAGTPDGGFIVAWTDNDEYWSGQDGANMEAGVYMQRFDADGVKVGDETRVPTTLEGGQAYPDIEVSDDGAVLIVWMSPDGSADGIFGQRFASQWVGTDAANTFQGQDADDWMEGLGGADTMSGGDGTDTLSYDSSSAAVNVSLLTGYAGGAAGNDASGDVISGFEALEGSAHNDILSGDHGANTLSGGDGNDLLRGRGGADALEGGDGGDTATYDDSAGWVNVSLATGFTGGGVGSHAIGDTFSSIENLTGSRFDDRMTGDDGNNLLEGGAGADTLVGGSGFDIVSYASSPSFVMMSTNGYDQGYIGGVGNHAIGDVLFGVEGLRGSRYNDILRGITFTKLLDGGDGDDSLLKGFGGSMAMVGGNGNDTVSYAGTNANVNVSLMTGYAGGGAAGDTFDSIENLTGSNYSDILSGDHGANRISGAGGNDLLRGRGGADVLEGGSGIDTATYDDSAGWVNVSLLTGYTGGGPGNHATGDTLSLIENLTGSGFDDLLSGDHGVNVLHGGDGNDILRGRGGADVLEGGDGIDTATFDDSAGWVNVSLETGFTGGGAGSHAIGDTFSGIENLTGSRFGDRLNGDNGNNVLEGLLGADTLDGNGGSDTASYVNSAGWVNVSLLTGYAGGGTGSHAAGDTFSEIENLTGSRFGDRLNGSVGNNVMEGGAGNDLLRGNGGADVFVFAQGFGNDTIADFTDGADMLDFSGHAGVSGITDLSIFAAGGDAVIEDGAGNSIILNDAVGLIDIDDFLF
ncbi:calcium-binding protein [uncultured Sulfitobacter sp.]|uniref:calcium-binding protein n=1 Tax=uncultured Sulfitobacter sp. TaxID=191468 RepID=UPI00260AF902|nr:calcium-binding protein [uncultured Sulfitobacter sp.]